MTTDELLQVRRPEQLYSGDPTEAKAQYHALAKSWHPDGNPNPAAGGVFAHITALYQQAVADIQAGTWGGAGLAQFTDRRGLIHPVAYLRSRPMELGRQYVGTDHVTVVADAKHRALVANAVTMTAGFTYASDKMRSELHRFLPAGVQEVALTDGRVLLRTPKEPDQLSLRHVLEYYDGLMPPRHVAWVLSRLYSLGCYLAYAGIVHHDISLDSCFIAPKVHSVALLGGWYYARRAGAPLAQVPRRTFECLPWAARTARQALLLSDQELIRATGRELLGPDGPPPMLQWLRSVARGSALTQFRDWTQVLATAFGPRRFVVMDLTARALYPPKGGL